MLHPSLPITATSLQRPFSTVPKVAPRWPQGGPKVAVVERFDCSKLVFNPVIHYFSLVFSVRCAQDSPLFFTEVLEKALDKSNSKTVTRVLVTRSEVIQTGPIKTERQNTCEAAEFWNVDDFVSTFTLLKEKSQHCFTDQIKRRCRCYKDLHYEYIHVKRIFKYQEQCKSIARAFIQLLIYYMV